MKSYYFSITYVFFAGLLLFSAQMLASEADDFPGIQKLMDEEQFRAAGLEQLNADQLKQLDGWLKNYTATGAEVVKRQSKTVQKVARLEHIAANIDGEFKGWNGNTVFKLDNGQVWQQRLRGRYAYRADNPKVVISRNKLGFYRLEVVTTGKKVGVKRIK